MKWYQKWLRSHNESKYTNYFRVLKTVTRAAQIEYYREKFDTRINTVTLFYLASGDLIHVSDNDFSTQTRPIQFCFYDRCGCHTAINAW